MQRFLFRFGYETPQQRRDNDAQGWDDEDCGDLFIRADSESETLAWGAEVAERFVHELYQCSNCAEHFSWREAGYACWIAVDDKIVAKASGIPEVGLGEYPEGGLFELGVAGA
ncbi:MAG TPA: hypothetical protein PKV55_06325 [Nitrospira sp.]|nr:hypothetical protein [Nitrospira sp.]